MKGECRHKRGEVATQPIFVRGKAPPESLVADDTTAAIADGRDIVTIRARSSITSTPASVEPSSISTEIRRKRALSRDKNDWSFATDGPQKRSLKYPRDTVIGPKSRIYNDLLCSNHDELRVNAKRYFRRKNNVLYMFRCLEQLWPCQISLLI